MCCWCRTTTKKAPNAAHEVFGTLYRDLQFTLSLCKPWSHREKQSYSFTHSLPWAIDGGDGQLHIPSQETPDTVWALLVYRKNLVALENWKAIPRLSRPSLSRYTWYAISTPSAQELRWHRPSRLSSTCYESSKAATSKSSSVHESIIIL
jgi:hypothetical protein